MNIVLSGLAAVPAKRPMSGIRFMNGRTLSADFAADPSSAQTPFSRHMLSIARRVGHSAPSSVQALPEYSYVLTWPLGVVSFATCTRQPNLGGMYSQMGVVAPVAHQRARRF
ncbi:hypothetical protein HUS13_24680 [Pseudomonas aeruginosa]|nr:hypothetical protein [Pseudomonas aeruginosa]QQW17664.1 hypothetical protein HUS13_24680 [Pseudomonas aeruginosa]